MASIPYDVYLNTELIDTVWFDEGYKLEEVWSSLVNHDGYDEDIVVLKAL